MITKNAMQFKAIIKKMAKEKNISPQLVMQNYMLERLLERISLSKYRNNFIFKGGFLISSIVGLSSRATMDLDTTIKGFTLTHEAITDIFKEICNIEIDDDITFEFLNITDIRETDDYPGIRVSLKANYSPISVPLTVDVTTGDAITPKEIKYHHNSVFEDKVIHILAYNLETILAEKIETVLSRSIANTRPRDYYDIYILYSLHKDDVDYSTLRGALNKTTIKRGSTHILNEYEDIVDTIKNDKRLHDIWVKYSKDYDYAKDISFDMTCEAISSILSNIYNTILV